MKTLSTVVMACVAVSLCACAVMPEAKINYYLARTDLNVQVDRTVACTDKDRLVEVFKVTPTPTASADLTQQQTLEMKGLKGAFSDANFAVGLYDDGRLKSLNGGTTGQGAAALKDAVVVAGAMFGLMGAHAVSPDKGLCAKIRAATDAGKTLTLSYETDISFQGDSGSTDLELTPDSSSYKDMSDELKSIKATWHRMPCTALVRKTEPAASSSSTAPASGCSNPVIPDTSDRAMGVDVKLRPPTLVEVLVTAERNSRRLWKGQVPVSQLGTPYDVYLPKAAAFGDTTTVLAINEYGALTSLQYTTKSGVPGAMTVLDTAASEKQTMADKELQKIKTKADTLAAQQRLVVCLATPVNCK